jgi:hypothetical protein
MQLIFDLKVCQPELVEGGFQEAHRLRQACLPTKAGSAWHSNCIELMTFANSLKTFYEYLRLALKYFEFFLLKIEELHIVHYIPNSVILHYKKLRNA